MHARHEKLCGITEVDREYFFASRHLQGTVAWNSPASRENMNASSSQECLFLVTPGYAGDLISANARGAFEGRLQAGCFPLRVARTAMKARIKPRLNVTFALAKAHSACCQQYRQNFPVLSMCAHPHTPASQPCHPSLPWHAQIPAAPSFQHPKYH